MTSIKIADPSVAPQFYKKCFSDCVVLTHDRKLLLQQRPLNWGRSAGCLTLFGGHLEENETPLQGVIRELAEELGARVEPEDIQFIDAVTEDWTDHTELVNLYFWHDRHATITGCYEAEPRHYETMEEALNHPKIMDYAAWALKECRKRKLL